MIILINLIIIPKEKDINIKIAMKYNQLEHTIKLYRNDIELGVEIQNINPGLYPAIEIYMEECKIKLSLNNDYQESFYL